MSIDLSQLDIKNNAEMNRFEVTLNGHIAIVEYMIAGKNIIFSHTEVPPEFEGMGVGGKLAHHVLEYAKTEGYKVQALCPFIASYVNRHPEYQSITWGY